MTAQPRSERPDPWTMLSEGVRQISRLDLGDLRRGFENFAHPSARGMLESLGRTREEQVERMAALLRNSSEEDVEEMGTVFGLAMARLAEERAATDAADDHPRRRRDLRAAEWRVERRQQAS